MSAEPTAIARTPPRSANEAALRSLADEIVAESRRQGADACKLFISSHDGLRAMVVDGGVSEAGRTSLASAKIDLWRDGRCGTAILTGARIDPVRLVAQALELADFAPRSDQDPLPYRSSMAWEARDPGLYHPVNFGLDQVIERAKEAHDAVLRKAMPVHVVSLRSGASATTNIEVVANSLGLVVSRAMSTYAVNCDAALQVDGVVVHGLWEAAVRSLPDLITPDAIAGKVVAQALAKVGPQALPTGKYRAILSAQTAAHFAEHLVSAMSGPLVASRGSWLAGRRGTEIVAPWIDIDEDPWEYGGINSNFFDSDGYRTQPRRIVEGGVLSGYLHDRFSAAAMGETPTGHTGGARNLTFRISPERLATTTDLMVRLDDGIIVTETFGIGVDLAAGRFSLGASGRRVVDGRDVGAIARFMIHGALDDLFGSVEAMGLDLETRGNIRIGSLLVTELSTSGD